MFECLILGDSIGLGAAKAINERYARHCDVQAVERATAAQILRWRKPDKSYGSCVFAMGSNDAPGASLARTLYRIFEHFGDVFTQNADRASACCAAILARCRVHDHIARQMRDAISSTRASSASVSGVVGSVTR